MKKFYAILSLSLTLFAGAAFADEYVDLSEYKPGSSLGWFYSLKGESQKKARCPAIEKGILERLDKLTVSDEAFFYACSILKPIASKDSIAVLAKFLKDEARSDSACDVLLGIDSSDVDAALISALDQKSERNKMNIVSTLAARNKSGNVEALVKAANASDPIVANFATVALGRTLSADAVSALKEIAAKQDGRKDAAICALNELAVKAYAADKKSLAEDALESVPNNYSMSILVRADLAGKYRQQYLESILMKGEFNSAMAGRGLNFGRTFENSQEVLKKFPTLNRKAKLAAMGTFMLTGDTRFYPTIAPEMDSADPDIKAEAIYAARFLCTDVDNLKKIVQIFKSGERPFSNLARNVLVENPSFNIKKVLKEESANGDLSILEILINRGDLEARKQLWDKFFAGDKAAQSRLESSITYGDLRDFAANFKTVNDEKIRQEMAKIIIKKLAKSREKPFMAIASGVVLKDNLAPSDPLYKFIGEKLQVKIGQPKYVWQGKYFNRAVDDRDMKVAKDPVPHIDDAFKSLFNGENLDGWHTSTGSAKYSVKDGCIFGETDPQMKQNSFLCTDKADYKNFIFVCDFKWVEFGNSGVIFRGQKNAKGAIVGPQAEIDDTPRGWSAGIYNEGAEWKYSLSRQDQEAARAAVKKNEWNRMVIYCKGDTIKTWLNGIPVADLNWVGTKPGFFGLQIHAGQKCKVLWKNILVKELK